MYFIGLKYLLSSFINKVYSNIIWIKCYLWEESIVLKTSHCSSTLIENAIAALKKNGPWLLLQINFCILLQLIFVLKQYMW